MRKTWDSMVHEYERLEMLVDELNEELENTDPDSDEYLELEDALEDAQYELYKLGGLL